MTTSMPAINVDALFIGRKERGGGDEDSGVMTEDDAGAEVREFT